MVRSLDQAGGLLLREPLDGAGNRISREVSVASQVHDLRRISALSMRFPD